MMEEKKSRKISLSTVLLFFAIIVIIVMAFYIYTEKVKFNKAIEELKINAENTSNNSEELENDKIILNAGDFVKKIAETENYLKNEQEYTVNYNDLAFNAYKNDDNIIENIVITYNGKQINKDLRADVGFHTLKSYYFDKDEGLFIITLLTAPLSDMPNTYIIAFDTNGNIKIDDIVSYNIDVDTKEFTITYKYQDQTYSYKYSNNEIKEIAKNEDNITYIDMTESNYKKYNSNGYRYEISDMIGNTDSTVTIKGRVYKLKDLPILTQKQYQDLLDGKTVTIMNYKMKMNADSDNGGHDFVIESEDEWMMFYVDKNSDGTGQLYHYTEIAEYEGTDIYMQITVDGNTSTESGLGNISLKQYLNSWQGGAELKDTEMLPGYNTEFVFENGKCTLIRFTSV